MESYDLTGKRIVLFATSGSSGFENTSADLNRSLAGRATVEEGIVVHGKRDDDVWKNWIQTLGL